MSAKKRKVVNVSSAMYVSDLRNGLLHPLMSEVTGLAYQLAADLADRIVRSSFATIAISI